MDDRQPGLIAFSALCAASAAWSLGVAYLPRTGGEWVGPSTWAGFALAWAAVMGWRGRPAARLFGLVLLPYVALAGLHRFVTDIPLDHDAAPLPAWRGWLALLVVPAALSVWGWLISRPGRRAFGVVSRAELAALSAGESVPQLGVCTHAAWTERALALPGGSIVRCHACGRGFELAHHPHCPDCGPAMLDAPVELPRRPPAVEAVGVAFAAVVAAVVATWADILTGGAADPRYGWSSLSCGLILVLSFGWGASSLWRGRAPAARGWLAVAAGLAALGCGIAGLERVDGADDVATWLGAAVASLAIGAMAGLVLLTLLRDRRVARWAAFASIPPTRAELEPRGGELSFWTHAHETGIPEHELALRWAVPTEPGVAVDWGRRSWVLEREAACFECGNAPLRSLPAGTYCEQCGQLEPTPRAGYRAVEE